MKWLLIAIGGVVGLILFGVLTLALLGFRPSAGIVDSQIEIEQPPAVVWSWLTEDEKLKQWVSWLNEVHDLTPGREGTGAQTRWIMIDPTMNDQRVEIYGERTEWDPHRLSTMKLDSPGMFTGTATYRLIDLDGGKTRVEYESAFHMSHWAARLFEPLVTPQARKKAEDDMARLKTLAESPPHPPVQEHQLELEAQR